MSVFTRKEPHVRITWETLSERSIVVEARTRKECEDSFEDIATLYFPPSEKFRITDIKEWIS